jgi:hypothetical protein
MLRSSRAGFCTGTLVASSVVLTAAHCIDGGAPATIGFGVSGNEDQVPVQRAIQHPRWNRNNLGAGHDIAVLQLAREVTGVVPKAFSRDLDEAVAGDEARVVGYGNNRSGTGFGTKREGDVDVLAPTARDGVSESWFVKVGAASGTQACNGDSGGPVFFTDDAGNEKLVGITSYGYRGCSGGSFHTRVAAYLDFIDDYVDPDVTPDPDLEPEPEPEPEPPTTDETAPSLTLISPAPDAVLSRGVTSIAVNATDAVGVTDVRLGWYNNGTIYTFSCAAGEAACTRAGSRYTFSVNVGTGTRYFYVTAVDAAGNESRLGWYRLSFR